jgi:hypothetical protein
MSEELFICDYCEKQLSAYNSKMRHMKYHCKTRQQEKNKKTQEIDIEDIEEENINIEDVVKQEIEQKQEENIEVVKQEIEQKQEENIEVVKQDVDEKKYICGCKKKYKTQRTYNNHIEKCEKYKNNKLESRIIHLEEEILILKSKYEDIIKVLLSK